MPVWVIDTLKPKNGLDFPVVEAVDVAVEGYLNLADAVTHFATDTAITALTESLQAQIDQIAQSAGAGTADTEIGQARVGADGTSYQTLKARLDAENVAITTDIAEFGKQHINLFDKENITAKKYVSPNDGSLVPNNDYFTSDYIEVSGFTGESINIVYGFTAAYYDSSKAFVSEATGTKVGNVKPVTIPSGVKYIRISGTNNNLNLVQLGKGLTDAEYIDYNKINITNAILNQNQVVGLTALNSDVTNARTSDDNTTYTSLKERLDTEHKALEDSISELGKERINLFNDDTVTEHRYVNPSTGDLVYSEDYYTSDFIDISGFVGEDITIIFSITEAYYDSSKAYVSEVTGTKTGHEKVATVPQSVKYIRISGHIDNLTKMQIGDNVSESKYFGYNSIKLTNAVLDQSQVIGLDTLKIENINLFNKAVITEHRYISPNDGSLVPSEDYFASDFIDVSAFVGKNINLVYAFSGAYYDSSKTFVSEAAGTKIGNVKPVEIPSGVTYIRVSGHNNNLDLLQVGEGLTDLQYFSYDDLKFDNISIPKNKVIGLQIPETHHVYVGASRAVKTISDALSAITDATENNKYIIHVDKGTYEETFHTKDYVDIIGENPYNTIVNYTSDDESDWVNRSTIFATSYTTLENLTITTTGSKYPLHCDGAYNVPYRVIVKNCILKHNGFAVEEHAGTGVGIGLYHSQHVELIECEISGNTEVFGAADIYCHNSADNDEAHSKYRSLRVERCVLGECTYGIRLQALEDNQLQDNDCWLISNINNGLTPEYFQHNAKDSWHVRKF